MQNEVGQATCIHERNASGDGGYNIDYSCRKCGLSMTVGQWVGWEARGKLFEDRCLVILNEVSEHETTICAKPVADYYRLLGFQPQLVGLCAEHMESLDLNQRFWKERYEEETKQPNKQTKLGLIALGLALACLLILLVVAIVF